MVDCNLLIVNILHIPAKMGFKKIKARVKNCRGAGDEFVIEQFVENYDSWQETVNGLESADKDEMQAAFNKVSDGLGDALTEDKEMFLMTNSDLTNEQKSNFVKLLRAEYFDVEE